MSEDNKRPRSFNIEGDGASPEAKSTSPKPKAISIEDVELQPDELIEELEVGLETQPPSIKRGWSWGTIFFSALGALVSLGIGIAVDQLIRDLFARHEWLGYLGIGITALIVLAAVAIVSRELFALRRLAHIETLREKIRSASDENDMKKAKSAVADLTTLYANRVDIKQNTDALKKLEGEIIDGKGLISIAERDVLSTLDKRAEKLVLGSAKRVSVVTAVSPRALIDVAFVLMESFKLIRQLAGLYGGRPGAIGLWRLTRNVVAHLAVTGTISLGDSLLQQVLGHGVAARISTRLGEGVINGLMTARIGIAATDLCRPAPFINTKRPTVGTYLKALADFSDTSKNAEK